MLIIGGCHDTAGRLIGDYREHCSHIGIPLEFNTSVRPPVDDASTLFTTAGMQHLKALFSDDSHRGTIANIQSCLRIGDLDEIGDGTHHLRFEMMGLFSFREMALGDCVQFWHAYLDRIGVRPTHVTIHPDRIAQWRDLHPAGMEIVLDPDCTWSDGGMGGYCTEFYVGGVEIGNIVNPRGDCLDVGFGLQRLALVMGEPPPTAEQTLQEAILCMLDAGYVPGNKGGDYVLRRLLRTLWRRGGGMEHPAFHDEARRQQRLADVYARLLPRNRDRSEEWWFDTHGITVADIPR
jgi:alanyl-tRNA synthetase